MLGRSVVHGVLRASRVGSDRLRGGGTGRWGRCGRSRIGELTKVAVPGDGGSLLLQLQHCVGLRGGVTVVSDSDRPVGDSPVCRAPQGTTHECRMRAAGAVHPPLT